ncbi:hypothetical protein Peur_060915 [Populus x canadensis]
MAAAPPAVAVDGGMAAAKVASQAYLETKAVKDTRVLIADLCKQFYSLGWVSGTGGSITIKAHDDSIPKRQQLILMSTSGVQKERMEPEDISLQGHGYYDELVVPIIENTAYENELTDSLAKAIEAYPKTTAVLVRKHGIYIWGDSWISAKTQVEDDLKQGIDGAVPIPTDDAGNEEVIAALVANVEEMIKADRKITALKQLQVSIQKHKVGSYVEKYENNELEGVVYGDVPEALEKWHALGIKVYIYSSGSGLAQRLIFGKTNYGHLRKSLSGFFDTKVGNKKETHSYIEISESLGVNKPSDILFLTDVFQEAVAAKAAGLEVMISIRPGNTPLPDDQIFKTITSFAEI